MSTLTDALRDALIVYHDLGVEALDLAYQVDRSGLAECPAFKDLDSCLLARERAFATLAELDGWARAQGLDMAGNESIEALWQETATINSWLEESINAIKVRMQSALSRLKAGQTGLQAYHSHTPHKARSTG